MVRNSNGDKGLLDRIFMWLAVHVAGYSPNLFKTTPTASIGMGRSYQPIKSYGAGSYSFYRVRPDEIGFTGSHEMYQTVKEAAEKSGLRYRIRYFGTRITKR